MLRLTSATVALALAATTVFANDSIIVCTDTKNPTTQFVFTGDNVVHRMGNTVFETYQCVRSQGLPDGEIQCRTIPTAAFPDTYAVIKLDRELDIVAFAWGNLKLDNNAMSIRSVDCEEW